MSGVTKRDTILIVDDEPGFTAGLEANLQPEGFEVLIAYDGETALEYFENEPIDLILLDLMLPGVDGLDVCRRIRQRSMVPIIMLTAKEDDIDKILGLEVGADDYLTKPFNFRELLARIRALMRRVHHQETDGETETLSWAITPNLCLKRDNQTLVDNERDVIPLTVKEFLLLELFAKNPGRVFTREQLLDQVWGYDYFGSPRTVDVHIRRLRKKLESSSTIDSGLDVIKTRWGAGYYLETPS